MANVDSAFGLRPVRYLNGAPYNGQANLYYVAAGDGTALFIGTPVIAGGGADATGKYPSVTAATVTSNENLVGVVVAVQAVTADSLVYRAASTERYVWVADDPQIVFAIQEDSTGENTVAASVWLNADWSGSGGSTDTGLSSVELDSSSKAATATLDFLILGLENANNNELGANANILVRLQNHQLVDGAVGVA